jgi:hypothetical protein
MNGGRLRIRYFFTRFVFSKKMKKGKTSGVVREMPSESLGTAVETAPVN